MAETHKAKPCQRCKEADAPLKLRNAPTCKFVTTAQDSLFLADFVQFIHV